MKCDDARERLQSLENDLREILWPRADPDADWSADTIDDIAQRLDYLRPQGVE